MFATGGAVCAALTPPVARIGARQSSADFVETRLVVQIGNEDGGRGGWGGEGGVVARRPVLLLPPGDQVEHRRNSDEFRLPVGEQEVMAEDTGPATEEDGVKVTVAVSAQ